MPSQGIGVAATNSPVTPMCWPAWPSRWTCAWWISSWISCAIRPTLSPRTRPSCWRCWRASKGPWCRSLASRFPATRWGRSCASRVSPPRNGVPHSLGPTGQRGARAFARLSANRKGWPATPCAKTSSRWISETLRRMRPGILAQPPSGAGEGMDVAQGRAPVHEEPQGLVFHHSYLSNAEAIAELRRKADAWGFERLREHIDPAYWVASGRYRAQLPVRGEGPSGPRRLRHAGPLPEPCANACPPSGNPCSSRRGSSSPSAKARSSSRTASSRCSDRIACPPARWWWPRMRCRPAWCSAEIT